jgi:hypothetical protein
MAKLKYSTIPNDTLVDIKISGSFYTKLVDLSIKLSQSKSPEEFKETLDKLQKGEPETDLFSLNISVVLAVIFEIEKQAKEQNKIQIVEVEETTT